MLTDTCDESGFLQQVVPDPRVCDVSWQQTHYYHGEENGMRNYDFATDINTNDFNLIVSDDFHFPDTPLFGPRTRPMPYSPPEAWPDMVFSAWTQRCEYTGTPRSSLGGVIFLEVRGIADTMIEGFYEERPDFLSFGYRGKWPTMPFTRGNENFTALLGSIASSVVMDMLTFRAGSLATVNKDSGQVEKVKSVREIQIGRVSYEEDYPTPYHLYFELEDIDPPVGTIMNERRGIGLEEGSPQGNDAVQSTDQLNSHPATTRSNSAAPTSLPSLASTFSSISVPASIFSAAAGTSSLSGFSIRPSMS